MANIKLLRTCMVGRDVRKKGWIGPADDEEAKALIAANYAVEHKGEPPADDEKPVGDPALLAILEGNVGEVEEALEALSKAQLEALAKLETEGSNRKGVHAAIESWLEVAE